MKTKEIKENIMAVLFNENGGPNVEQVIGIAVAFGVGAGLFLFGKSVYGWFNGSAKDTVGQISTPPNDVWTI